MKPQFKELSLPVPTRVVYGKGLVDELGWFVPGAAGPATIVTGRGSARRSGLLDRVRAALGRHGMSASVIEGVEENPSWSTCRRGRDQLLRLGTQLVIALGGGSVLDAGKAMALAATNAGELGDLITYKDRLQDPLPTVAIPTTAGTGSEVTQYCIITDETVPDKLNLRTDHTFPRLAILDPACTASMPPAIALGTGMDALCHAVEGYLSRRATGESSRLALESVGMIGAFLEASTRRPHDAELREKMLLAAATAGAVIAHTGTIALHALGYRLTLDHGVHHGLANAILLHPFLCVTREYEPAKVQDILDALLGAGATLEDLRTWAERLGIDMALSKYGVKRTEFAAMAGYVMGKKNLPDNPFAVTAEAVCQVLSLAMDARRGSLVRKGP